MRFHGDAASSAVEDAAVNYQAPSIIAAGADAQSVSFLATVVNLSLSLILIKAPTLIEKAGLSKKGAVTLSFLNLCSWVPLAIAFLIGDIGITPGTFAFLWILSIVPGLLLSIQRDNWLSNLVPKESLGRYLGQRLAIKSAFYLGAFCLLGYLLDVFGNNKLMGFGFIFTIATTATLLDFVVFTYMHEPTAKTVTVPRKEPKQEKFRLFEYFRELKEKKLESFVSFTTLFYLTVGLSGPLYAVYMLGELHFTYLNFTVIIAVEYFARIVSAPLWGRLADKAGNIRVLGIVSRIIPLIPIFWLFSSHFAYLAFIQSLSGVCWGAYDLCTQSYLYKVAPPQKKLRYIVYTRSMIMLSSALGGLLGAYIVKGIFPIFGSQILSIFLVSGLFRAGVVLHMMPKLVDLAVVFGQPPKPPKADLETLGRAIASKRGMFYRRHKASMTPGLIPIPVTEFAAATRDLSPAQRRKWHAAAAPAPTRQAALEHARIKSTRRRVYNPTETAPTPSAAVAIAAMKAIRTGGEREMKKAVMETKKRTLRELQPVAAAVAAETMSAVADTKVKAGERKLRPGLYYNSTGWADYMKRTLKSIIKESQGRRDLKKVEVTIGN
ncbi:MAG: hypothetical protein A2Z29_07175 [Chloroflexi bacterium RBG_16_56_11]|nr:MAG: hypothetical protein A2Z29_07175 [Chloroflexi bacterium RBG_16_56_11]